MPARTAAATIRTWSPGTYRGLYYRELLDALDHRIDRLNHVRDPIARLRQGVELLVGLFAFSEELASRCWSIRGALELSTEME
jgi:hypothetical protein